MTRHPREGGILPSQTVAMTTKLSLPIKWNIFTFAYDMSFIYLFILQTHHTSADLWFGRSNLQT